MNFGLDSDQKAFRDLVLEFVERECPREVVRKWDAEEHYPAELMKKMGEQGFMTMFLPEEFGGLGKGDQYLAIIGEALSRYSSSIGAAFYISIWGCFNLIRYGSEEQKRTLLPKIASGETKFSISITEPDAGSDAAAARTRAELDGDEWVINGEKVFSTSAHPEGNIIMLLCRTDPDAPKHQGLSVILVPNDTPGVEIHRINTLSRRMLGTNRIFFRNVRVPKGNLLGELNKGWDIIISHLERERMCVAAGVVGNAQQVVDDAKKYALERVQFGRPIAKFQVIRHMLADMQTSVDAARLLTYRVAWMLDEGIPCNKEAAMAKLFATEMYINVSLNAMRIMGGYGQTPEYDAERALRDATGLVIGGGTSQIQRTVIAKGMGL